MRARIFPIYFYKKFKQDLITIPLTYKILTFCSNTLYKILTVH